VLALVQAHSRRSFIGGLVLGLALVIAAVATFRERLVEPILGLVASGLLLVRFLPATVIGPRPWPTVPMVVLGILTGALCLIVLTAGFGSRRPDDAEGPLLPGYRARAPRARGSSPSPSRAGSRRSPSAPGRAAAAGAP
jgi:uncharacterized membrane protein (UPF0136 family)